MVTLPDAAIMGEFLLPQWSVWMSSQRGAGFHKFIVLCQTPSEALEGYQHQRRAHLRDPLLSYGRLRLLHPFMKMRTRIVSICRTS